MESDVIKRILAEPARVIATGGGAFAQDELREGMLAAGVCFYLKSDIEHLYARVKHDSSRPLLVNEDPLRVLKDILARRGPVYEKAHVTVLVNGKKIADVASEVLAGYGGFDEK